MSRRVLFVTTTFDQVTNGPGVYTQNLWKFFSEDAEIDFHVVAIESSIKHERLHLLGQRPPGFGSATYKAISTLAEKVLKQLGPQTILHANMAHIINPKLAAHSRSIVQINDTEVCSWSLSLANLRRHNFRRNAALCWRKLRERQVARNASKVICNSQHTTRAVQAAYNLANSQVSTIYKAIDLEPFQAVATRVSNAPSRAQQPILFVGSNWRRKGLDTLLKAVTILRKENSGIRLRIIGKPDASTLTEFENQACQLELGDCVEFVGTVQREDLPNELASASLLALPSYEEALGLAAIEALASGIPVVASRVGGLPEIIRNSSCGQLVEPGNAQALASAIDSVLHTAQSPELVADRQATVARFSLPRLESELRQLYAEAEAW